MRKILTIPILLPLWFYRFCVSPLMPPSCRFEPSCSGYALEAIKRHGAWAGLVLSVCRLASCHPFEKLGAKHGFDPVPLEILPIAWYAPWKVDIVDSQTEKNMKHAHD